MSTVNLKNGVLYLIGEGETNQISIKPNVWPLNATAKYWGTVNGVGYSVLASDVQTVVVVRGVADKVFFDSRLTVARKFLNPTEWALMNPKFPTLDLPGWKFYGMGGMLRVRPDLISYIREWTSKEMPVPPTANGGQPIDVTGTQIQILWAGCHYTTLKFNEVSELLKPFGWGPTNSMWNPPPIMAAPTIPLPR